LSNSHRASSALRRAIFSQSGRYFLPEKGVSEARFCAHNQKNKKNKENEISEILGEFFVATPPQQ
jgi:hypothetical protein